MTKLDKIGIAFTLTLIIVITIWWCWELIKLVIPI